MLLDSSQKTYINDGNDDVAKLVEGSKCNILDLGCGNGALAGKLSAKGHQVDGVTLSGQENIIASKKMRDVETHNLESGLPSKFLARQYDYVICSHVLEHIVYPDKLLFDIYHVLKQRGNLIVALPNLMHYKSRLKILAGNFDYEDAGIWDNTHVKWYTLTSAQKLIEEKGFSLEVVNVTGELPFNSIFSKILPRKTRKLLFHLLTKISKGFFGYQILFKFRK